MLTVRTHVAFNHLHTLLFQHVLHEVYMPRPRTPWVLMEEPPPTIYLELVQSENKLQVSHTLSNYCSHFLWVHTILVQIHELTKSLTHRAADEQRRLLVTYYLFTPFPMIFSKDSGESCHRRDLVGVQSAGLR